MNTQHTVKCLGGLYSGREKGEKIDPPRKVIFITSTCNCFAKERRQLTVFLFTQGKNKAVLWSTSNIIT